MILDLDSTLIRTEDIKKILFDFVRSCGFKEEEVHAIYNEARNDGDINTFTLGMMERKIREHVDAHDNASVCFDETAWGAIRSGESLSRGGLLIEGADELIRYATERGIPYRIVTLGVEEWQKDKVQMSGLADLLEQCGVEDVTDVLRSTEAEEDGKLHVVRDVFEELGLEDGEGVLFVNDKPEETERVLKQFNEMHGALRRERRDRRYGEEDYKKLTEHPQMIGIWDDLRGVVQMLRESDEPRREARMGDNK